MKFAIDSGRVSGKPMNHNGLHNRKIATDARLVAIQKQCAGHHKPATPGIGACK